MKHFSTLIFFLFAQLPIFAQLDSSLCSAFKTGSFAYRNDSAEAVLIRRTMKTQEEIVKKTGVVTKFKIRWISLCSYELQQVWSNSKRLRKSNGGKTIVIITAAGSDNYAYRCACKEQFNAGHNVGTVYRVP